MVADTVVTKYYFSGANFLKKCNQNNPEKAEVKLRLHGLPVVWGFRAVAKTELLCIAPYI